MKKKVISLLLAALLLIGLLPVVAMADSATITASVWNESKNDYDSLDRSFASIYDAAKAIEAAASTISAVTMRGKVSISEGEISFNGRQTIDVPGIILEGAGSTATTLYASNGFSAANETSRKALLTISADNVIIKGLTLDGRPYGSTLSQTDDFIVVRINSGDNIALDDVAITGSKRTLLHVGTSDKTAAVTAKDLICEAEYKSLPSQLLDGSLSGVYADIEVNPGSSLTVESGTLDAFAKAERGASLTVPEQDHYTLRQTTLFGIDLYKVTTTAKHFVESYNALQESGQLSQLNTFKFLANADSSKVLDMAIAAIEAEDQEFIDAFEKMLNDVVGSSTSGVLVQALEALESNTVPGSHPDTDGPTNIIQAIAQIIIQYILPAIRQLTARLLPFSR